jgi:hypothetical protein
MVEHGAPLGLVADRLGMATVSLARFGDRRLEEGGVLHQQSSQSALRESGSPSGRGPG